MDNLERTLGLFIDYHVLMVPSSRPKVIVVSDPWRARKAIVAAIVIAATSIAAWGALAAWHTAWDYEMPTALFLPIFTAVVLIYPIAAVFRFYRHLPTVWHGLTYSVAFGCGWHFAISTLQAAEYGVWKGFRADERTFVNQMTRQVQHFVPTVLVCVAVGMAAWGLCRLFRGEILIPTGSLCMHCGYDLTGNVSGRCPECGTAIPPGSTVVRS